LISLFVESGTRSLGQCPTTAGIAAHDGRSVRAFAVKPRACGAPQKRRWGLTAWRGRAIPVTVPPMPHDDAPVNHRTRCRTTSDRSSAGFLTLLSLSTISTDVLLGTPVPHHPLAS
jgi:hypothetical protein